MLELSRTVRFCLNGDGSLAVDAPQDNTFAAWPPMQGLGRYYELEVSCRGEPDQTTGYFVNIKEIDQVVRRAALPMIADAARSAEPGVGGLMRRVITAIDQALGHEVTTVTLRLTPTYSLRIEAHSMNHVLISQQYEFSASHRLHSPKLSAAENTRIFGKCNNPAGHGHNYRLEVTVRAEIDPAGDVPPTEKLDAVVSRAVIDKLDHKHLDVDVEQFKGLNTSVENIAAVIWGMLEGEVLRVGLPLDQVRVWETGKTVCAYRGGAERVDGDVKDGRGKQRGPESVRSPR